MTQEKFDKALELKDQIESTQVLWCFLRNMYLEDMDTQAKVADGRVLTIKDNDGNLLQELTITEDMPLTLLKRLIKLVDEYENDLRKQFDEL